MTEQETIKTTLELKKLAEEYREECPYLHKFGELLERASIEHKAVLDALKDR